MGKWSKRLESFVAYAHLSLSQLATQTRTQTLLGHGTLGTGHRRPLAVNRALISGQSKGRRWVCALSMLEATFLSINTHKPLHKTVVLFASPALSLEPEFQHICAHNPLRLFKLYTLLDDSPLPQLAPKCSEKHGKMCWKKIKIILFFSAKQQLKKGKVKTSRLKGACIMKGLEF